MVPGGSADPRPRRRGSDGGHVALLQGVEHLATGQIEALAWRRFLMGHHRQSRRSGRGVDRFARCQIRAGGFHQGRGTEGISHSFEQQVTSVSFLKWPFPSKMAQQ